MAVVVGAFCHVSRLEAPALTTPLLTVAITMRKQPTATL
jgi:hypothetical protein